LLQAYREDLNLKEAALKLYLTAEQFDKWVRPEDMTDPLTKCHQPSRSVTRHARRDKDVDGRDRPGHDVRID
jgi:hypothetical protein